MAFRARKVFGSFEKRTPEIGNNRDIIGVIQIELPNSRTMSRHFRNTNRHNHSAMIAERASNNITGRHRRDPHIRYYDKVKTRRKRTITPRPGITGGRRMEISPDVDRRARVK